ncbi:MAG: cbb3-type cytochrome oxidase assembly protein CcoS [Asticcacaulis sp.]|nr:cbb3-type cytochrome oxidase assembly protein CcoS [Asticcacaulis sp.]
MSRPRSRASSTSWSRRWRLTDGAGRRRRRHWARRTLVLPISGGALSVVIFLVLIPLAFFLGLIGLAAFMWALNSGQFEDPERHANEILREDNQGE